MGEDGLPPVRSVAVGDAEVAYVVLGDPHGPPAVLLAGLSDGLSPVTQPRTRAMLAEVPLPMGRFRGIALSHPSPLGPSVTTRELAAAAAEALRQVVDGPAVVAAHSLGAMVAQHLAADAPDLVRALVLSATVARADDDLREILGRWDGWLRAGDARAFARDALETSFTGEERARRRGLLDAADPGDPDDRLVARHLALSGACSTHDALERLAAIRVPTLVLAGAEDVVAPVRHARQLAARITGARLEVLPGVGHAFPEQAPRRFEALVTGFLAALPDQRTSPAARSSRGRA